MRWTKKWGARHPLPSSHDNPYLMWTTGESNPDFLVAGQASFRWTSSPSRSNTNQGPPENRTRSPVLQGRDAAGALAARRESMMSLIESSRRESNPRFLFVREMSLPLDHGTIK